MVPFSAHRDLTLPKGLKQQLEVAGVLCVLLIRFQGWCGSFPLGSLVVGPTCPNKEISELRSDTLFLRGNTETIENVFFFMQDIYGEVPFN